MNWYIAVQNQIGTLVHEPLLSGSDVDSLGVQTRKCGLHKVKRIAANKDLPHVFGSKKLFFAPNNGFCALFSLSSVYIYH